MGEANAGQMYVVNYMVKHSILTEWFHLPGIRIIKQPSALRPPQKEYSRCDQFILEFHKPFEMRRSIFNIYQTYDSQSNSDVLGMKQLGDSMLHRK